jgi:uncharacterized membrane protein YfcA
MSLSLAEFLGPGVDLFVLAELALAVLLTGAVVGVLAGLFGIGGGAIIVPVLYEIFAVVGVDEGIRMHVALGTSLGVVLPTAVRSFRAHLKRGTVDMAVLKPWVFAVPAGVVLGSLIVASLSSAGLRGVFAVLATLFAAKMLFGRAEWRLGDTLPTGVPNAVVGIVIGFISTLMGIGGGVMSTVYMTLYGRSLLQAISTSAGVGALIAVPGTLGYMAAGWGVPGLPPLSIGFVSLIGVGLIIPAALVTTPLGVRLAHSWPRRRLEIGFGIFLLTVAARFASSLIV